MELNLFRNIIKIKYVSEMNDSAVTICGTEFL